MQYNISHVSLRLPKQPITAKQSVVLTGLGSDKFDQCARGILEVHTKLSSSLPPGSLQLWRPLTDQGRICLEFSNRYFASGTDSMDQSDVALGSGIDPAGVLAQECPEGRHTEDNVVLYFDRTKDETSG